MLKKKKRKKSYDYLRCKHIKSIEGVRKTAGLQGWGHRFFSDVCSLPTCVRRIPMQFCGRPKLTFLSRCSKWMGKSMARATGIRVFEFHKRNRDLSCRRETGLRNVFFPIGEIRGK
ncbi:hypothetical protein CDAR_216381 [Caerostris darwini]|uniref:Ribosomal protein L16 n=1 Tax=Caerostris darwini TaxID=1538125 RepID=A0AAV4PC37_9ARAC|nr:hypothetical protein CDAR_216381 [Caerostris darwini]